MATKYDEAAYLNDNNTFDTLTLDEAIECIKQDENNYHQKYDGRLYCPKCNTPKIGIVCKNNHYFYRGYPKAVHDIECDYGFEPVKSAVLQEFALIENNRAFLNEKLQRFVNRFLNRDNNHIHNLLLQVDNNRCMCNDVNLANVHNRRNIRRIPTKSITAPFDYDDFNCFMLFYGKVDAIYRKVENTNNPFYKLNFYKCGKEYSVCSLNFSSNVAMFVQNEYHLVLDQNLSNVYVAFFSVMKKEKDKYLNAKLTHSELFCISSE